MKFAKNNPRFFSKRRVHVAPQSAWDARIFKTKAMS